jgi:hypothetical protein
MNADADELTHPVKLKPCALCPVPDGQLKDRDVHLIRHGWRAVADAYICLDLWLVDEVRHRG